MYKAFTYLVKNNVTNKWYYGVKYAKGCRVEDLWTKYFTSSDVVRSEIVKYGINAFSFEIRKIFNNVETALKWEEKVLKRMKVRYREDCYNQNDRRGFPIPVYNETRPSPLIRLDVIKKANTTRIRNNLAQFIKNPNIKKRGNGKTIKLIVRYKNFIKANFSNLTCVDMKLDDYMKQCSLLYNKKHRHRGHKHKSTTKEKIRDSKIGRKWYTSPCKTKAMLCKLNDVPPDGWIQGLCTTSKVEKHKEISSNQSWSEASRKLVSERAKKRVYYTSPCGTKLTNIIDGEQPPEGWIKGNKLISRNNKISKYLKEVRYANCEKNQVN